jgi:hypothetical protein
MATISTRQDLKPIRSSKLEKILNELVMSLPHERPSAVISEAPGGFLVQSGWDLRLQHPDSGYQETSENHKLHPDSAEARRRVDTVSPPRRPWN